MIYQIIAVFNNLFRLPKIFFPATKKEQLPSKKLYKNHYTLLSVEEVPDSVCDNVIYHVGENKFKWLAVFKCPCGCGAIIQLNLLKEANPRWRIKFHDNGDVSLYPSINRRVNCKSHFNITRNSVRWWDWA
ncbi:MAG TPA: DUF6527 family protein [Mucilaginibacter sp.]|jgi:hypothetical protein